MKKSVLYLPLWGTLFLLFSCQGEGIGKAQTEAIITGYDFTFCGCCGGYMVTTGDDPNNQDNDLYLWRNAEDFPDLDLTEFPISIRMDFEVDDNACSNVQPWINISDIEIVE
ncbi:MAG: hypothetical protein AAF927_25475 [Bacteroidota bacterium]